VGLVLRRRRGPRGPAWGDAAAEVGGLACNAGQSCLAFLCKDARGIKEYGFCSNFMHSAAMMCTWRGGALVRLCEQQYEGNKIQGGLHQGGGALRAVRETGLGRVYPGHAARAGGRLHRVYCSSFPNEPHGCTGALGVPI